MPDDMPLIDPHHHLWDMTHHYYPWLNDGPKPAAFGDYSAIISDYLVEDFLDDAKRQKLVKSVHIEVGYDPADPVGETRWLQGIADKHGFPHGIVGYADLRKPDVGAVLDAHMAYPNFRGIRQSMNYHPDPAKTFLDQPEVSRTRAWRRGFRELVARDLSFDLQIYYPQADEFLELARDFPQARIILDHAGMQVDGPDHFDGWRRGMAALAEAPNVACKISGFGMGDFTWTTASIRPYVEATIALFGIDRCMFASNFPVDKLFSSYDAIFDAFRDITRDYPSSDRRKLFHDNAARFYRL